jgi:DNA-binding response OmpR family regulator
MLSTGAKQASLPSRSLHHSSRLRSKIDKGFNPPLLHTVRGAGYMIRDEAK